MNWTALIEQVSLVWIGMGLGALYADVRQQVRASRIERALRRREAQ